MIDVSSLKTGLRSILKHRQCDRISGRVPLSRVIKTGVTTLPGYADRKYAVYLDPSDLRWQVRIATEYEVRHGMLVFDPAFESGLCATVGEWEAMPRDVLDRQAYNTWMCGAR